MDAAEHARILHLVERIGETVEVAYHGGHAVRRDAERACSPKISGQDPRRGGADARMGGWIFGKRGRHDDRRPFGSAVVAGLPSVSASWMAVIGRHESNGVLRIPASDDGIGQSDIERASRRALSDRVR